MRRGRRWVTRSSARRARARGGRVVSDVRDEPEQHVRAIEAVPLVQVLREWRARVYYVQILYAATNICSVVLLVLVLILR